MHYLHVLGPQHLIDSLFLCLVEPRKRHGGKAETLSWLVGIEQVAQTGEPVALGLNDAVERVKHRAVTGLVKREPHSYGFLTTLKVERMTLRHDDHHTVAIDIRNSAREGEISNAGLGRSANVWHAKEKNRFAKLEVMSDVLIRYAEHLNSHLIERIIERRPHPQREPRITAFHLAPNAHGLGLLAKRLFFSLILYLEQQTLLL